MAAPTAAFTTEAAKRQSNPIYLVIISLDGGDLRLMDKAATAAGKFNALPVLSRPAPIGVTISPFEGRSSVSRISLNIIDKAQVFSKVASKEFLLNRIVTIKVGFEDIDEADFFTEYIGKISGYKWPQPGRWQVDLDDTLADLTEKIPDEDTVTVVETAFWNLPNVPTIIVASAQDAPDPQIFTITQSFDSANIRRRTFLGKVSADTMRLYQVGSITVGNTFTTWDVQSATPLADGLVNSNGAELLGDKIVDVMLNLFKRVDVPDSQIQVSSFIAVRDTFALPGNRVRRVLAKPARALDLMHELARISLLAVFPDEENRLTPKFFSAPEPHDDIFDLDTSRIQPVGNISMLPNFREFANRIVILGNHDGSQFTNTENFRRVDIFVDADSQSDDQNKEVKTHEIKSQWLNSSVTDLSHYSTLGGTLRKRIKHPPRHVKTAGFLDLSRVKVADIISLSHPEIPGQPVGKVTPGVDSELWQIISKRTDVPGGIIPVELLDTRIDKLVGWISHTGQADFPTATGIDKRHAYIGTANSNLVNNGTEDGYYIQ